MNMSFKLQYLLFRIENMYPVMLDINKYFNDKLRS